MGYSVTVEKVFSAAHAVTMPNGFVEPFHGHDFRLRVTVGRPALDSTGFVVDFHELEANLERVVGPWRNNNLNDLLAVNPTAENVVETVRQRLVVPAGVTLDEVEITEAQGCLARWRR